LDEEAEEELSTLRNREFLIEDRNRVILGMLDVLAAFAYDHRTTSGEPTVRRLQGRAMDCIRQEHSRTYLPLPTPQVESCWTITTLSPSLSWLESYVVSPEEPPVTPRAVLVTFVRRCLTYPYLRRWDLAMRVVGDVGTILSKGRRAVLRCLLKVGRLVGRWWVRGLRRQAFWSCRLLNGPCLTVGVGPGRRGGYCGGRRRTTC
jgi:protein SHQ1